LTDAGRRAGYGCSRRRPRVCLARTAPLQDSFLRPSKSIAVIVAALAGILGLSLLSVRSEQERLVDDFTAATRQQAHASVEALTARLDALDQDTRLLTDLVEHSGAGAATDPTTERRVWEGAFRALAVVVPQYRTLALVEANGTIDILASDPTETHDNIAALVPPTQRLALDVAARNARALGKTVRQGD